VFIDYRQKLLKTKIEAQKTLMTQPQPQPLKATSTNRVPKTSYRVAYLYNKKVTRAESFTECLF